MPEYHKVESLRGTFLLATSKMPDPRFKEQIIYLCSHDDTGAMGFVINQPSPHSLADIFKSVKVESIEQDWPPVYFGGPVEGEAAFFLYSADYVSEHSLDVGEGVRLSRDPQILHDIAQGSGPLHYIFLLGYAGWGPGQLETELRVNGWLSLPADQSILFDTPDRDKWHKAAKRFGIDIVLFDDQIGSA